MLRKQNFNFFMTSIYYNLMLVIYVTFDVGTSKILICTDVGTSEILNGKLHFCAVIEYNKQK